MAAQEAAGATARSRVPVWLVAALLVLMTVVLYWLAIRHLQEAVRLKPDSVEAQINLDVA